MLGGGIEGVTLALDGVVLGHFRLGHHAAVGHFPGCGEIQVVSLVIDVAPALDHQRLEAALAEFLGNPPSGDAGAHDNGVEIHESQTAVARPISENGTHGRQAPGTSS
jgi:hypothetical protein